MVGGWAVADPHLVGCLATVCGAGSEIYIVSHGWRLGGSGHHTWWVFH